MNDPKYSKIYCAKCESDKISLDQMKCLSCGSKFKDEDVQRLLKEAYDDHVKELNAENEKKVEILAGDLDQAIIDLNVKAKKTFNSKEYQVWEMTEEELKKIDIEESQWKDDWGWWRFALGSNMSWNPIRRYNINNRYIKAYDGDRRIDNEVENESLPVDERWDSDKRKYEHLLGYLSEEIGASQPRNVCAICVDLARINQISMAELFKRCYKDW